MFGRTPTSGTKKPAPGEAKYEAKKRREAQRQRDISQQGREIGSIPECKNPKRRKAGGESIRKFAELYLPGDFPLAWSKDHATVLRKTETAIRKGGLFAIAMPRGSGKTTIMMAAAIWAAFYGHRKYIVIICADKDAAVEILESIKVILETNDDLCDDFPEVCFPIQCLDGIAQRAKGQLCEGKSTLIRWKGDKVILPTIAKSEASGVIIQARGLLGRIRGLRHKAGAQTNRPDFVVVDDPQTDESANSVTQSQTRENVLAGAILGLAGPGKKISAIVPCTVIVPGDMADNLLDRNKHPEYQGERLRMVYEFPTNAELWDHYGQIYREALQAGDEDEEALAKATAYYRAHREQMDAGAAVAWPERFDEGEISGLQHAMNIKLFREYVFWAECQNDPVKRADNAKIELEAGAVARRVNLLARGVVPDNAHWLTAMVDVQQKLLWWVVCAWADDFTGAIIDYGTYPDQERAYYTNRDARRTMQTAHKGAGLEGALSASLGTLIPELLQRRWERETGGEPLTISRLLIDANWKPSRETIFTYIRRSPHRALLLPSFGLSTALNGKDLSQWKRDPGERAGDNWFYGSAKRRGMNHVVIDTRHWKHFIFQRLGAAAGDRGAVTLFGKSPGEHRMLSEHLSAEWAQEFKTETSSVIKWTLRPGRDNHLFDCVVGSAVAASMQGANLIAQLIPNNRPAKKPSRRKRVSYLNI